MENEVVQLYLDDIIPNRFQPREVFDDQALKELAVSIREHGVIQPILVRKFGEKYEIIAGERRYKASTMAGLTKIPAIVKNLDDKESSKVALIENLQRRDLTPIEEARTYQKILDLDEMTQEQLAKTMGKSQSAVSNKLRLLSLPDEIQESLLKEEISERHARSLLNVDDKNVQVDLLKEIVANKMTVRELDSKIKKINGEGEDTTSDVSGGSTVVVTEEKAPEVENVVNETENSLFGAPAVEEPKNELFEEAVKVDNILETPEVKEENNTLSSLFGEEVKEEVKVPTAEVLEKAGDEKMNNSLFDNSPVNNDDNNFFQAGGIPDTVPTTSSLFGDDPTTVDINKIREQSFDINPVVKEEDKNIKGLIDPNGFEQDTSNRFIPNFEDSIIEKTEDGNEVIGNGLLAGMPVIKPVDTEVKEEKEDTKSDLFNTEISLTDPLTGPVKEEQNNNDLNSLFAVPTVENIKPEVEVNTDSLFGTSTTQNEIAANDVVTTNNVQVAVAEVKDVIKTYQEKGYTISVEELDLDREIQLIVKFNKN